MPDVASEQLRKDSKSLQSVLRKTFEILTVHLQNLLRERVAEVHPELRALSGNAFDIAALPLIKLAMQPDEKLKRLSYNLTSFEYIDISAAISILTFCPEYAITWPDKYNVDMIRKTKNSWKSHDTPALWDSVSYQQIMEFIMRARRLATDNHDEKAQQQLGHQLHRLTSIMQHENSRWYKVRLWCTRHKIAALSIVAALSATLVIVMSIIMYHSSYIYRNPSKRYDARLGEVTLVLEDVRHYKADGQHYVAATVVFINGMDRELTNYRTSFYIAMQERNLEKRNFMMPADEFKIDKLPAGGRVSRTFGFTCTTDQAYTILVKDMDDFKFWPEKGTDETYDLKGEVI